MEAGGDVSKEGASVAAYSWPERDCAADLELSARHRSVSESRREVQERTMGLGGTDLGVTGPT